jgi:RHS repeat-associated protein
MVCSNAGRRSPWVAIDLSRASDRGGFGPSRVSDGVKRLCSPWKGTGLMANRHPIRSRGSRGAGSPRGLLPGGRVTCTIPSETFCYRGAKRTRIANQAPSERTICTCVSNTFAANELRSPDARALHVLSTLRARFLDPVRGRFLSRDPLLDLLVNFYWYALNNPVLNVDPSGLQPVVNCSQGAEANCVGAAIALAQKAINNLACQKNLGQLTGNKANCTSQQLSSCISQAMNIMTVSCQDLAPSRVNVAKPCQIAFVDGSYSYAQSADTECYSSKNAAKCNPCQAGDTTDNCALCAGMNRIPVNLCRTPDPATFPKPWPKNPSLSTPIDKVYCAKGVNDPNVGVLASHLIHEASHSCVGGHRFTQVGNVYKGDPFDQCRRPDATLVQNAYSDCMGWPKSKNPRAPEQPKK